MTSIVPPAMRRSARQPIQATFFSPFKENERQAKARKYKETSDSGSDAGDSDSDSDTSSADMKKKMSVKKGNGKKGKSVSILSSGSVISPTRKGPLHVNALFGILKKGKITDKDVNHWISVFKSDRVGAMCDLVNFLLQCAGAQKEWIRRDVDLEALEAEELDELLANMILSMHQNAASSPLDCHNKESKKMRERFVAFWESLTSKIIAKDDGNIGQDSKAIETLQIITDQLVALSSMIVMSVRDVVTEASMTVGRMISSKLVDLRSMMKIAERQLKAETSKQGKQQAPSKKTVAIQKEKAAFDRQIVALTGLCETVFNSIFIHRYKDSRDEIRALCAKNLGNWIATDMLYFGKDEFLKYIGWMCSDASKDVRRASIDSLVKVIEAEGSNEEAMQSFVEYFIDRFIEIACGDEDEDCTFKMLVALRVIQGRGLIDFVTESQLDNIDMKVFDPEATLQIRQEALHFMMDHTQGFQDEDGEEEEEEESPEVVTTKKKGGKQVASISANVAMANRRKMAMKLETFAEFVEHHQGKDNLRIPSEILCRTCLSLDKCKKWMRDWSTMTLLLLREGDELTSNNLNDTQCAVLLRILACSAKELKSSVDEINSKLSPEEKQGRSKKAMTATNDEIDYDLLSEELIKSLPRLLVRFRDDEDNLSVLADLLPCCNVSSGSLHQKSLKVILGTIMELMTTTHNQVLIDKLCFSLQTWNKLGGSSQSQVEATIRDLLSFSMEKLDSTQNVINNTVSSSSSSKNAKGKRGTADEGKIHDALYGLSSSITLLKCLTFNIDFRPLIGTSLNVISEKLTSASEMLTKQCEALSLEGLKSRPLLKACIKGLQHTARCIHSFLIWNVRDVFNSSEELRDNDDMNTPASIIDSLELREKLITIIHSWLKIDSLDGNNPKVDLELDYRRSIQYTAFEIVGDLRLIFAARLQQYRFLDSLVWMPSKEFLDDLRTVFETEEEYIRGELETLQDSLEDTPEDAIPGSNTQALSARINDTAFQLVDKLLAPVCQVMIYDVENINRRQAASILMHIQSPYDIVKKFVRDWVKELKKLAIVKLLEIQLVTLKMFFEDRVIMTINQYKEMEEDYDKDEAVDHVNDQLQLVIELAKTLSSSMFVGKAKGESLEALGKLFLLGMEYAFSDGISSNIKFLNVLTPYIKLFESVHLQTITEYYDNHITNLDIDIDDEEPFEVDNDSFELYDALQTMRDYRATLIGGKIVSARSKRIKATGRQKSEATADPMTVVTDTGQKQRRIQPLDEVEYGAQEPGLSFTSVTKSKRNTSHVGLHLESIRDSEEYDSESDYEKGGTVKKVKPGGTVLKRTRSRSSVPTLSLEEQDEEGEESEEDSEEEERRGGTAVKAKRGGTVIKRGRSSVSTISLQEQEDDENEEDESLIKKHRASNENASDDSDSENDIASWRRSSVGGRRR